MVLSILTELGWKSGDLIVAVDGETLDTPAKADAALSRFRNTANNMLVEAKRDGVTAVFHLIFR